MRVGTLPSTRNRAPLQLEDHLLPRIQPSAPEVNLDPFSNLKAICRIASMAAFDRGEPYEETLHQQGRSLNKSIEKATALARFHFIRFAHEDVLLEEHLNPVLCKVLNTLSSVPFVQDRIAQFQAELHRIDGEALTTNLYMILSSFEAEGEWHAQRDGKKFLKAVRRALFPISELMHGKALEVGYDQLEKHLSALLNPWDQGTAQERERLVSVLVAAEGIYHRFHSALQHEMYERAHVLEEDPQPEAITSFGAVLTGDVIASAIARKRINALGAALINDSKHLRDYLSLLSGITNQINFPDEQQHLVPPPVSDSLLRRAVQAVAQRQFQELTRLVLAIAVTYPNALDESLYEKFPELIVAKGAFPHTAPLIAASEGMISKEDAIRAVTRIGLPGRFSSFAECARAELQDFREAALRGAISGIFGEAAMQLGDKLHEVIKLLEAPEGVLTEGATQGKVVLVTGASSGIGLSLARLLRHSSHRVIATARRSSLTRVPAELTDKSDRFIVRPMDIVSEAQRQAVVAEAMARWKGIDVLINNAGVSFRTVMEHATEKENTEQLAINYLGPVDLTRLVLPHMRAQRWGRIINVSSVGGIMAMPTMGSYSASKFALEGASEAWWYELRPWNVRITLVQPGFVRSDSFKNVYWSRAAKHSVITRDDYEPYYRHMARFIEKAMQRSFATPESIAKKIIELIDRKDPPLRMTVSIDGTAFSLLRRFFPRSLYHEVLYRFLPQIKEWVE